MMSRCQGKYRRGKHSFKRAGAADEIDHDPARQRVEIVAAMPRKAARASGIRATLWSDASVLCDAKRISYAFRETRHTCGAGKISCPTPPGRRIFAGTTGWVRRTISERIRFE
jgi:hypothetical protein